MRSSQRLKDMGDGITSQAASRFILKAGTSRLNGMLPLNPETK
jgi:hypothetical protein